MKKIAAVLASFLVVACASAPKTEVSPGVAPSAQNTTQGSPSTGKADNPAVSTASVASSNEAAKANETQSAEQKSMADSQDKSIYFDFDSFAILADYRDVLKQQAAFIKAHKDDVFVLEGNADERGSGEYNLALGNKRANAVRKSLVLMGIPAAQLKVVSFGKEKPRLTCHEEKCWHENRRVDFVIRK